MSTCSSPFQCAISKRTWAAPAIHLLLAAIALVFTFPMYWMLLTSVLPVEKVMALPPRWFTARPRWSNYGEAVGAIPFLRYAWNTLFVCSLSVAGMVISSALTAFAFARRDWPGRDLLFNVLLGTMMVPFAVVMVPLFGVYRNLGWVGTTAPLWLPSFFGNAFNVFLLRQFFLRIPQNLPEAMALDGASELTIFRKLYVPLSKPALAVVALFHFNWTWNDFMGPLLYLSDQKTFTLSLGLQQFQSRYGGTQWHLLMAAAVLSVAPMVLLFIFTQKTFLQGVTVMKDVDIT